MFKFFIGLYCFIFRKQMVLLYEEGIREKKYITWKKRKNDKIYCHVYPITCTGLVYLKPNNVVDPDSPSSYIHRWENIDTPIYILRSIWYVGIVAYIWIGIYIINLLETIWIVAATAATLWILGIIIIFAYFFWEDRNGQTL
jgi:hypothetical protein